MNAEPRTAEPHSLSSSEPPTLHATPGAFTMSPDECPPGADAAASSFLEWDADLKPPATDAQTAPPPAVLIIRERPGRPLWARAMPALVVLVVVGGLLTLRSLMADWPGLLTVARTRLARDFPTWVEPAAPNINAPVAAPPTAPELADVDANADVDVPPPLLPPAQVREEAVAAPPAAEAEPASPETEAALADIEREAQKKKAEQAEIERLKDQVAEAMPPPAPPGPLGFPGFMARDLDELHRQARQFHQQQIAAMRRMFEESRKAHDEWLRAQGIAPLPDLGALEAWGLAGELFGEDGLVPPPPAPGDAGDRQAQPRPAARDRARGRVDRQAPGNGRFRRFVTPDGRVVGFQWRWSDSL